MESSVGVTAHILLWRSTTLKCELSVDGECVRRSASEPDAGLGEHPKQAPSPRFNKVWPSVAGATTGDRSDIPRADC